LKQKIVLSLSAFFTIKKVYVQFLSDFGSNHRNVFLFFSAALCDLCGEDVLDLGLDFVFVSRKKEGFLCVSLRPLRCKGLALAFGLVSHKKEGFLCVSLRSLR